MKRLATAAAVTMLLAGASAQPGPAKEPRARATALRIVSLGPAPELIRAGEVVAEAGAHPRASGTSLTIAGRDFQSATATLARPDAEQLLHTYGDPTGSFTLDAGFARAHVTGVTSSASAGFATGTGSGFALADELFTFEEQEQLLGAWAELMDAIFTPLNDVLGNLDPALETLGLDRPTLEGISPEGLVDIGRADMVASNASTSSSPGFSSARADADVGELSMFGGFIQASEIAAEAISESVPGADDRRATATIGSVRIAGLEVVADGDGFRLAGNGVLDTAAVQPVFDLLLGALETAGIRIKVADQRADGDLREATALEISVVTPGGSMIISVAHAEAAAASVGLAPAPAPVPQVDEPPPPPATRVLGEGFVPPAGPGAPVAAPPPGAVADGPIFRRPGPEAARAMKTAYLLTIIGGLVAAMALPLWVKRTRRPRASLLEGVL